MARIGDYVAREPFKEMAAVTLHDTNTVTPTDAIFVGGAGNLAAKDATGADIALNGLLAGHVYHVRLTVLKSTGSTATNIVALYYGRGNSA